MSAIDELTSGMREIHDALAEESMRPDHRRGDWLLNKSRVKELRNKVGGVLAALEGALAEARESSEGEELDEVLRGGLAHLLGRLAAVCFLAGETAAFRKLIGNAEDVSPHDEQRAELKAARRDPEAYCELQLGRWLNDAKRSAEAKKVLRELIARKPRRALISAAREALDPPRPVREAPNMFRVNGCGVALYGNRDTRTDGSFVSTLCVCLLFIPVFPLAAYRVWEQGGGYAFHSQVGLSTFARVSRWLLVAVIALVAGGIGVVAYLDSPQRRVAEAIENAERLEADGDREGALMAYRKIVDDFAEEADVTEAVQGVVRVSAASVPSPCKAEHADLVGRVVNGFYELPERARSEATHDLVSHLLRWSDEIGDANTLDARAGLSVVDMAVELGNEESIKAKRQERLAKLADMLSQSRPLEALSHYVALLPDARASGKAHAIIETLGEAPSPWIERQRDIRAWIKASVDPRAKRIEEQLERAEREHKEASAIVEAGDEKGIAAALEKQPGNQELAIALAQIHQSRGEIDKAIRLLTALGAPGRMTADAQQVLGLCYSDAGRFVEADAVLTELVAERIAPFQKAQRSYASAVTALQARLVADLEAGNVADPVLESKLKGAPESEQGEILRGWLADRVDADAQLADKREQMMQHQMAVPATVALGTVKLRRASEASGSARDALLAEAERTFLSIRGAAEGQPTYHLGLGVVYHRLGRAQEGDAELNKLLELGDPQLSMAVANAYRDLGILARTREILEKVHGEAPAAEARHAAAHLLALIAISLEDKEQWLLKCDQTQEQVKANLIEVRGHKLARDGDLAGADRAYAEVVNIWERDAKHNAISANNAAVSYFNRYQATGDAAHMKAAIQHLESSVRMQPDSPLPIDNLMNAVEQLAFVEVLGKWMKVPTLALTLSDARDVASTLLDSDHRDALLDALRQNRNMRRALELSKQLQVLAPHNDAGWRTELMWLRWTRDAAALRKLHERLSKAPSMQAGEAIRMRREYESGRRDDELKRTIAGAIKNSEQRLERARATAHAPTIAVAWHILGQDRLQQLAFDEAGFEAGVQGYREAADAWPEGGYRTELAGVLMTRAILAAKKDSRGLSEVWKKRFRTLDIGSVVDEALRGPDGGEVLAALRKQASLPEALEMARSSMKHTQFWQYQVAVWIDDKDSLEAVRPVLSDETLRYGLMIESKLMTGEQREASALSLFERARKE